MAGRRWTDAEESLLGTDADAAIAKKIGRSKQAVLLRRHKLGIAPCRPQFARRVSANIVALTGTVSDSELSRRTGHTIKTIRQHRLKQHRPVSSGTRLGISRQGIPVKWTTEQLSMLGQRSDADVAREMGISRQAVRRKRVSLGIII